MSPTKEDIEKFNEGLEKIKEIMEKYNLGFSVQHQVIILPRTDEKKN
jgi:hypothetical protein